MLVIGELVIGGFNMKAQSITNPSEAVTHLCPQSIFTRCHTLVKRC